MKKIRMFREILLLWIICCSCEPGERIIQRPVFTVRTSNTLEIDKIVLNDTATIFYIDAFFRPKYWIRIDSGTYLRAGDQKFPIAGSKGIKLQDYHWMPDSGKSSFQLIFPPLERSVKQVDFIESDCKDCFKIYGVQLRNEGKMPDPTAGIPKELRNLQILEKSSLPGFDFQIGKTELNIHLLGYQPGMGENTVTLYYVDFISNEQKEVNAYVDEQGNCRIELEQYGSNTGFLEIPYGRVVSLLLAPGEEMEVFVDLPAVTRSQSRYQQTEKDRPTVYTTGKYAAVNTLGSMYPLKYSEIGSMNFLRAIKDMNAEEYVAKVKNAYDCIADSIRKDVRTPQAIKDLNLIHARAEVLNAIGNYRSMFKLAHRLEETDKEQDKEFKIPELTEKHYEILKELDLNRPEMLYSQTYCFSYPSFYVIPGWEKIPGSEEGSLFDLWKIQGIAEGVENLEPLTSGQEERLKSIGNPFYLEAFQQKVKSLQEQQKANLAKGGYTVGKVPDVASDKLFEAIIAPYKGKVVFVDFWATWCGPCRQAIRELEPAKSAELKNDNIVFVYITGDSSPLGTWRTMIPDIKGDHYRLSDEQWNTVCEQFGIEGIPSYVLVDKEGKYKLRKDLRNHDKLKNVLLREAGR